MKIYLIYGASCPHCHVLMQTWETAIKEKVIKPIDIDTRDPEEIVLMSWYEIGKDGKELPIVVMDASDYDHDADGASHAMYRDDNVYRKSGYAECNALLNQYLGKE